MVFSSGSWEVVGFQLILFNLIGKEKIAGVFHVEDGVFPTNPI